MMTHIGGCKHEAIVLLKDTNKVTSVKTNVVTVINFHARDTKQTIHLACVSKLCITLVTM